MTYQELKDLFKTLDLNRSVRIGKHFYVNNAKPTVEGLFTQYEGAKNEKQRERYSCYLNTIEKILIELNKK